MFDTLATTTNINLSEVTPKKYKINIATNDQMLKYILFIFD